MENFTAILVGAVIVESLIEVVKSFIDDGKKINWNLIVGALLGVLIAFNCHFDIIQTLGLDNSIPYLGYVLTGIFISRGSNFVHDIIKGIADMTHAD